MSQLSKYAFANVKIRSMLSYLLSQDTLTSLLEARDYFEAIELLKKTNYNQVLQNINSEEVSVAVLEKEFLKLDIESYYKVERVLSSGNEQDFVSILRQRFEIEELKVILRIWHNKQQSINWEDYIIAKDICFKIDFRKLVNAQSLEEFILLLDHTPYKKPLLLARENYKEKKSCFYFEASLDVDYYQRLLDCLNKFSSVDKKVASKILGIEVDIENINWLIRLRKYYSLGIGEMLEWFIPGGSWVKKDTVRKYYTTDGLAKVVESISFGPYTKVKDLVESNVLLIENFLYEFLLKEVKRALSGFPFTIGTVISYLILKHRETKNIISILNAKKLGWRKEEIVGLIGL